MPDDVAIAVLRSFEILATFRYIGNRRYRIGFHQSDDMSRIRDVPDQDGSLVRHLRLITFARSPVNQCSFQYTSRSRHDSLESDDARAAPWNGMTLLCLGASMNSTTQHKIHLVSLNF